MMPTQVFPGARRCLPRQWGVCYIERYPEELVMPPEELRNLIRARPFVPFRLHVTDGRTFEVRHPDSLLTMARVAVVGVYNGDSSFPDRSETIALIHIVSVEPLAAASPQ
jgi:hypothetical protein